MALGAAGGAGAGDGVHASWRRREGMLARVITTVMLGRGGARSSTRAVAATMARVEENTTVRQRDLALMSVRAKTN